MINESDREMVDNTIDLINEVSNYSNGLSTRPPLTNYLPGTQTAQFIFEFSIDKEGWRKAMNSHCANVGRRTSRLRDRMEELPSAKLSNSEREEMGMSPRYDEKNPIPLGGSGFGRKEVTGEDIGNAWGNLLGMMGYNAMHSSSDKEEDYE